MRFPFWRRREKVIYTVLDSDEKIIRCVAQWGGKPLAVDFECEYNLHIYGEHLCLIQVFDGEHYWIIDVRSPGVTPSGLKVFFSSASEKVWFDIQGDAALVYRKYGLRIDNVFDVRVPAMMLGNRGNLISLIETYLKVEMPADKKKNQTASWLRRPLDMDLIEYALNDVRWLFDLKSVLLEEIGKRGLEKELPGRMKGVTRVREPLPGWRHIGNWRQMSAEVRDNLKSFFIVRDCIARRFNVPPHRVMDKHTLLFLSENPPKDRNELRKRIMNEPPRFRSILEENLWKEMEKRKGEKKAAANGSPMQSGGHPSGKH